MAIVVALVVAACDTGGDTPAAPATSTTPAFPYPPFEIRTDVAVPLEQPLLDAARFALEMSVDARRNNDPDQDEVHARYRSRIAPEADAQDLRAPDKFVGETGGALHRAVAARELPTGDVEVSVCLYDTPGLYAMESDGALVPADSPDTLWRPTVAWTTRPAADGSTPPGPRWLLLNEGAGYDATQQEQDAVCGPFRPQPFVREAPEPTSETAAPTSR